MNKSISASVSIHTHTLFAFIRINVSRLLITQITEITEITSPASFVGPCATARQLVSHLIFFVRHVLFGFISLITEITEITEITSPASLAALYAGRARHLRN
jgi:hypothetical protein